ncbi:hypothetical protein ACQU0X_21200 [Pseudovibrio ascidiaceicola]|uniref:hypothetical protein n=1 Tax=Pseudovibrio ascidiaceicola TaxID=285279 RepID=UPI003D36E140
MGVKHRLRLSLTDKVPDAKTIWLFREKLAKAGAIECLFERFDKTLREAGYIAMSGQLVDASLIAAPKQRNTEDERNDLKQGRIPKDWRKNKAKLRQKDTHALWTVQFGKARQRKDGSKHLDIAIPHFGYKAHTSVDKGYRFIRKWLVTDAASHDGRQLRRGLLDKANTGSQVWRIALIALSRTRISWRKTGLSCRSIVANRKVNRCPPMCTAAITPNQNIELLWSMSLPTRSR